MCLLTSTPLPAAHRWEDVTLERARFVFDMFNRKQWQWEKLYKVCMRICVWVLHWSW